MMKTKTKLKRKK